MKWIAKDGMVFPRCPRCESYPMIFFWRDDNGYYLLQCPDCGFVVGVKTHPAKLALRALERRWKK